MELTWQIPNFKKQQNVLVQEQEVMQATDSEANDNQNLQLFRVIPVLTSWTSHKPLPLNVTQQFLHFLLPVGTSKAKICILMF
jgi:hypothetical protein